MKKEDIEKIVNKVEGTYVDKVDYIIDQCPYSRHCVHCIVGNCKKCSGKCDKYAIDSIRNEIEKKNLIGKKVLVIGLISILLVTTTACTTSCQVLLDADDALGTDFFQPEDNYAVTMYGDF